MSALTQGTKEWLELRKSKIGASDAPIIMGQSPWSTAYQLWEYKLGLRSEKEKTFSMQRGNDLEEKARTKFSEMTNILVAPRVMFHPQKQWMMASLDGMDIEQKVIVEIKCPNAKDHAEAKSGKVPDKYYFQLQHQLAVCNLEMAFYFSFDGEEGELLEVARDEKGIKEMMTEEEKFWQCMNECVPPELDFRDFKQRNDYNWGLYASRWVAISKQRKKLEQEEEELRQHLIQMAEGENVLGAGVRLSKVVRKGNIDYKAVPELMGVDLEKYRKGTTTNWRITNAEISDT